MSAYNVVIACDEEECPRCGSKIQRPVQFKYGDTWQYQYKIGDRIRWGGNDIGEPGHKVVVVEGYADECPVCGHVPDQTYDITIRDDVIECVLPSDGTYDYVGSGKDYFVVEP
jgi:rRNA maturation protein Nop10